MKLQVVYSQDEQPHEIIGIVPFRDKVLIATQGDLLLMEHDEETMVKIRRLVALRGDEFY